MNNIIPRLKQEILAIIPPTVFFFAAFQLIAFTQALMLEEYGIQISTFMTASIAALIVSKVALIVDLLPFCKPVPRETPYLQCSVENSNLYNRYLYRPLC